MAKLELDNKTYEIEKLSNEAKAQLVNVRYVDRKISELKSEIAALNAARFFYINELKNNLPKD